MARRRSRSIAVAVAALAAAAALAGCGLGAGRAPTGVRLQVTSDFGSHTISLSSSKEKITGAQTVMSLLMHEANISTAYSGGFVESIDGHSGGEREGAPVDWFYYVNGMEAEKGAAATEVQPGERIWWDLHDWSQAEKTPAVVGSFPEPFLDGIEGKRLPVRMECVSPQAVPCKTVTDRLDELGSPPAFAAIGPAGESEDTITVLVGTFSQLRASPIVHLLEGGPSASGVYARVTEKGRALALLDAHGHTTATLHGGSGLIAATRYADEGPAWIVAGTDEAGVKRAAAHLDARSLDGRFAVAVQTAPFGAGQSEVLPLPQTGG